MPRHSRLAALRNARNLPNAKQLRGKMTDAEAKLWYYLRGRRFEGRKFRRQVPLGDYVVDFVCEHARLIIEVDGGQHADRLAYDGARTAWLESRGYGVVRFWNHDVLGNMEGVLESLSLALGERDPLPGPLPRERGA